ncbi:MAG: hypothetical protein QM775_36615 [Pirellulales bacterium]
MIAGTRAEAGDMWCNSCRQDVPGVTSPTDGKNACPRCGTLLGAVDAGLDLADFTPEILEGAAHEATAPKYVPPREETPDFKPAKPPRGEPVRTTSLRWEAANWELNEKLRHVERVTATSRRRFDEPSATPALRIILLTHRPRTFAPASRSGTAGIRTAAITTLCPSALRAAVSLSAKPRRPAESVCSSSWARARSARVERTCRRRFRRR